MFDAAPRITAVIITDFTSSIPVDAAADASAISTRVRELQSVCQPMRVG